MACRRKSPAALGPRLENIVFAISAPGWLSSARVVRGQILSLKHREHVIAAQALGCSNIRIMLKHLMPLVVPVLVVHLTFTLSGVIIVESSLSFLGLGAQGFPPTWGVLLSQGKQALFSAPHLTIAPGLFIATTVLSLNLLGDLMRDVLDPKSKPHSS